jgi:nitric oxide reductase subunit C
MNRVTIAAVLFVLFVGYSFFVYTKGTESSLLKEADARLIGEGKQIFQQHNCNACHQIYGLGGYLGTDLTTAYSDAKRGEAYMRAILRTGGSRMPDFHFSAQHINAIIAYLKYVDSSAHSIK